VALQEIKNTFSDTKSLNGGNR